MESLKSNGKFELRTPMGNRVIGGLDDSNQICGYVQNEQTGERTPLGSEILDGIDVAMRAESFLGMNDPSDWRHDLKLIKEKQVELLRLMLGSAVDKFEWNQ